MAIRTNQIALIDLPQQGSRIPNYHSTYMIFLLGGISMIKRWMTVNFQGVTNKERVPRFPVAIRFKEDL